MPLVCFPYAGAGAAVFREWREHLPTSISPLAIEYPGRGSRLAERPLRSVAELSASAAEALLPILRRPYAVFGHSLGARVAYEFTRLLSALGHPPVHLFVSGCRALHLPPTEPSSYALPLPELCDRLRRWGGAPEEVLTQPELLALLEPALRADLEAAERHQSTGIADADVPITAFAGTNDSLAPRELVADWSKYTSRYFALRLVPGGHFFLQSSQPLLIATLVRELDLATFHAGR